MGNETEAAAPAPVLLASLRAPTPNARVHALPCTIEHDGPAAIRTYFMPRKVGQAQDNTNTKKETVASGDGKEKNLPEGDNKKMDVEQEEDEQDAPEGTMYEAQFRGRDLKGVRTACPKGTVGFVARETALPPELVEKAPSAGTNRYWSVDSEFRSLTLWHHDFAPPLDHCFHQVEEWCALAQAIHEDTD